MLKPSQVMIRIVSSLLLASMVAVLLPFLMLGRTPFMELLGPLTGPKIDLFLILTAGGLTAFIAAWAGHVATTNKVYRWVFWIAGTMLAGVSATIGVRNYQAQLKAEPTEAIVMRAVNKSNEYTGQMAAQTVAQTTKHTDEQVGTVRSDLKKATEHSDEQTAALRSDLKGAVVSFGDLVSKTENDLNANIAKVGRPDPPEQPKITFTLLRDDPTQLRETDFPLLVTSKTPDSDGTFTIDFLARNTSNVIAENVELWVVLCDACSFVKEPQGFDRADGSPANVRHRQWGPLNAGVNIGKMTIQMKPNGKFSYMGLTFAYACKLCSAPETNKQDVKIVISK